MGSRLVAVMRSHSSVAAAVIAMGLVVAMWSMCSPLFTPAPSAVRHLSRVAVAAAAKPVAKEKPPGFGEAVLDSIGRWVQSQTNENPEVYSAGISSVPKPENPNKEYTYDNAYNKVYIDSGSPHLNPVAIHKQGHRCIKCS